MSDLVEVENEKQEIWGGWGDFLGNIGAGGKWTKKILLKFLIEYRNNFINASGAELLLLLEEMGLSYKIKTDTNFRKLIQNEEGSEDREEAVDDYIKQLEDEEDEDIDDDAIKQEDILEEIDVSDEEEIEERKLLEGGSLETFKMLDHEYVHMEDRDEEFVGFLMENRINKLWNNVINKEISVEEIKKETGEKYFTLIKDTFLEEYNQVSTMENPANYNFKDKEGKLIIPSLMQRLSTLRLKNKRVYGNWSGVGTGKTLAAVYAGRHIELKNTLVVTFNSTIDGWCKSLKAYFPDSVVHEKMSKDVKFEEGKYNYLVVNYEFFQTANAETKLYEFLEENRVDYFVLDEVHSVKQRYEEDMSNRRILMMKFMNSLKEANPDIYAMAMTATPVINNLVEAKKMLELLHGKKYDDLSTNARVVQAGMKFHQHFACNGVRYKESSRNKQVKPNLVEFDIYADNLYEKLEGVTNNLEIDQISLSTKLEATKKYIRKGTIIYTYFVGGIVERIAEYVEGLGLTVGIFTGEYKEGLDQFRDGEVDVLIGSSPIGTGVDGLQFISNRMIILSLPWTYAEYDQLIGRICRQGSNFNKADIIIPKVVVDYYDDKGVKRDWSRDRHKWNIINYKKDLFSIVMDGIIPDGIVNDLASIRSKSLNKLNEIIEKLNNGEFNEVRRELEKLFLEHKDYEAFERKLGDFSKMNKEWSTQTSANTHDKIVSNPKNWIYYHKRYREARENWSDVPYVEIAKELRKLPLDRVIGDFGCGENLFSTEVDNEIKAFDHFAIDDSVTACDVSKLPIEDDSLDAGVFSLSLMGSNYIDYLTEAYRVLKPFSPLYIAEPRSKWEERKNGVQQMIDDLTTIGYSNVEVYKTTDQFIYVSCIKK